MSYLVIRHSSWWENKIPHRFPPAGWPKVIGANQSRPTQVLTSPTRLPILDQGFRRQKPESGIRILINDTFSGYIQTSGWDGNITWRTETTHMRCSSFKDCSHVNVSICHCRSVRQPFPSPKWKVINLALYEIIWFVTTEGIWTFKRE